MDTVTAFRTAPLHALSGVYTPHRRDTRKWSDRAIIELELELSRLLVLIHFMLNTLCHMIKTVNKYIFLFV